MDCSIGSYGGMRPIGILASLGCGALTGACGSESAPTLERSSVEPVTVESQQDGHTNRLAGESSPYLLQHAHNPVDWYPWGPDAFARAKAEDKPIFLSIGYSTCHWCHVMERESFENEAIAALMNQHFVCIKVDREERPDVDALYMDYVQAATGSGGWPMSVFLAPDLRPFFGGTYYPPTDRHGRIGFPTLLLRIANAWETKRDALLADAAKGADYLTTRHKVQPPAALDAAVLGAAAAQLKQTFDPVNGGFGGTRNKFPRPHTLDLLLRMFERTRQEDLLEIVTTTLDAMAAGGIHDHLGGGFHRYSTDPEWFVPHFEKMLYDQAQLLSLYADAWLVTGEERFAAVARDIVDYVLRDMRDPAGGFWSAEDADSEGEEGKFYVWTKAEILEVLGDEAGEAFCADYGVKEDGNWTEEGTAVPTGTNILAVSREGWAQAAGRHEDSRAVLLENRGDRIRPGLDDMVLVDWNGLWFGALAHAGRALGEAAWVQAATEAADFVAGTMRDGSGRLLHRYRTGQAGIPGFLEDHAFAAWGFLELYEATFDPRWLGQSVATAKAMGELFFDEDLGSFRMVGSDQASELVAPTHEIYDGAIPSGNSVAAEVLLRLAAVTGDTGLDRLGHQVLETFSGQIAGYPTGFTRALGAADWAIGPAREVVLAGMLDDEGFGALRAEIDRRFLPRSVVLHRPDGDATAVTALAPFVEFQTAQDGRATAYVCENRACRLPVTEADALADQLDADRLLVEQSAQSE